jgi:ABC-type amino acid transport substrate-binding protein
MQKRFELWLRLAIGAVITILCVGSFSSQTWSTDLAGVKKSGVLRHLGIPYANFVTGSGDGLDVELMQLFARHLKVRYEYVKTDWPTVIQDLTGKVVKPSGDMIQVIGQAPVKGDVIANGFTVLPWREKVVLFSAPTFPTQVWLMTRSDSPITPIRPTGTLEQDIVQTKNLLKGRRLLGKSGTCLEPSLYGLESLVSEQILFPGNLNELAPAVMNGDAETTLLDVPDALVALGKWGGQIKIIGPISSVQDMAPAFALDGKDLREAFNTFYKQLIKDGTYPSLVKKYYPAVFSYFPEFFTVK